MVRCVVAALVLFSALPAPAQVDQLPKAEIDIQRFYKYPLLNGRSPSAPSMSPAGDKIVFGWNQTGQRRLDVWIMDYPGGAKRMILDSTKIEPLPNQDDDRTEEQKKDEKEYDGGIAGFQWSPDGREIMFSYKGRVWLMEPDGDKLHPLFDSRDPASQATYSPDGKYIVYMRGQNVHRLDRKTGAIKQITFISKARTSVSGFTISPDGKSVAVTWSDDSKGGSHVMMDFTKDRAQVVNISRMWHGEKSQSVQVGVVSIDGGLIKFVEGLPRYTWLENLAFSPNSKFVALASITEDFQRFQIRLIGADNAKASVIYDEKAPKNYIPDFRPIAWSRKNDWIYFGTDIIEGKFGNRSIMRIRPTGGTVEKVYAENHDVAAFGRAKDSDRWVLVTMARSPLKSEITILEPNGQRTVHVPVEDGMATPKNFDDAGLPLVSDDGKRIATVATSRVLNGEIYGVEPKAGRLTQSQLPEFAKIKWAVHREVTFPGPDGKVIHGVLIENPNLDKTKKHPAFISNMYANSAKLAWNGYFENYAAMELGMVVLQIDFRASWGYGGEFNSGYWKSMGIIDSDEAVAGKKFLESLGYVKGSRVGLWGWSYGGFLTCMIQLTKPDFHAGVAVASVTDWKTYNEWYTRRRLGMAADDAEAYKKTSPISFPEGLKNHLFLVHGMLDDNVLFQDTGRLMQKLIEKNKPFDLMLYPREDHGIGRNEARPHVMREIMRYLYWRLNEPEG